MRLFHVTTCPNCATITLGGFGARALAQGRRPTVTLAWGVGMTIAWHRPAPALGLALGLALGAALALGSGAARADGADPGEVPVCDPCAPGEEGDLVGEDLSDGGSAPWRDPGRDPGRDDDRRVMAREARDPSGDLCLGPVLYQAWLCGWQGFERP